MLNPYHYRIMRPAIVLVLTVLFGHNLVLAQDPDLQQKITVDYNEVSLETILQDLTNRSHIRFSYSIELIPAKEKITCNAKNKPLIVVLGEIFNEAGIKYELIDGYLVLTAIPEKKADANESRPSRFTISGTVSDSATHEMMIGAAVFDRSTGLGVITNNYGFYSLTLPAGSYNLQISYVGYTISSRPLELTSDMNRNIQLQQVPVQMKAIIINSEDPSSKTLSLLAAQTNINPMAIQRQSAALGETDVLKSLDNLPGISYQSDGSSYFSVRGGGHDQNLILLDEAPLYNPSHMLGLFTPIIPEAIKHVEIYRADFPVQYGGRLSSVIDIRAKDGNMKRFSGSASLGPVSTRFSVEGPLKKDASSYFVSFRVSTLGLFVKAANPTVERFRFSDFTSKFNVKIGKRDRLYLTLFSGKDAFINKPGNVSNGLAWQNTAATLRWSHVYGNKLFSNTTLYGSKYNYSLYTNYEKNLAWNSDIRSTNLKTEFSWYITPKNNVKFGVNLGGYFFNPGNYNSPVAALDTLGVSRVNSSELVAYAGEELKIWSWIQLNYGFRISNWSNYGESFSIVYNDQYLPVSYQQYAKGMRYYSRTYWEPRVSVSFRTGQHASVKASYNRNTQNINQINNSISPFNSLDVWLPSGPNILPQHADIYDLGFLAYMPGHALELTFDAYYKRMYNQIGYQYHAEMFLNPYLEGELRQGDGYAKGFEIMLQKTSGRLTGQISYGYVHSTLQIPGLNRGKEYLSHQDKPIDFSFTVDFRLKRRWTVNLNMIYTSGMPLSTPTGFYYYRGNQVPLYLKQNNDRLPDYKRLDLGTQWRLNKVHRTFEHYLSFTFYNFFSYRNYAFLNFNKMEGPDGKYYVPADKTNMPEQVVTYRYIYSLVPSFTYSLKF
jgi:hypothetical protein